MSIKNPFIHEAATSLEKEEILELFIGNQHSRLLDTKKNIFLIGHRGSGKSMLLRHNSFDIQYGKNNKNLDKIGIYISCRNTLLDRDEYAVIEDPLKATFLSEYILILYIAQDLLKKFDDLQNDIFDDDDLQILSEEIKFYFNIDVNPKNCINKLYKTIKSELNQLQINLLNNPDEFFKTIKTYSSLILPLIDTFKETKTLKNSHFMLMIDDAQLLNKHQMKSLSSWIAFRDTSQVSFKIAITSKKDFYFIANNNNSILEDHDYATLDLEKSMFSGHSNFKDFAKEVLQKRLDYFDIKKNVDDFFPLDEEFNKQLQEIRNEFTSETSKYKELQDKTVEQRKNKLSKYDRAIYFRLNKENHKENQVTKAYTGFKVLHNLSTGVIRNLLLPCYKMYEIEKDKINEVKSISTITQYQAIKEVSEDLWDKIQNLSTQQYECTDEDAEQLKNFLENFSVKLEDKLLDPDGTEKQILSFTIEDLHKNNKKDKINHILNIAIRAGMIYTRIGPDKSGGRTIWYTPNRLFWPSRGLDPVGQNGRMNIKANEVHDMLNFDSKKYKKNIKSYDELNLFTCIED